MEICIAEGKILNDMVMSVPENNLGVHHRVYQDNFYNSVNLVGILSKHTVTGCGTVGPNRGILKDLEKVIKQLKRGQSFCRKGDPVRQCRICSAHKKQNETETFVSFVLCHITEEGALKSITPSDITLYLCCKHQMTSWCISCKTEVYIETSYALKL